MSEDDKRTIEVVRKTNLGKTVIHLPYSVFVETNDDGSMFANVLELPGCMTEADDDNLDEMVEDAILCWVWDAVSDGESIPLPYVYGV